MKSVRYYLPITTLALAVTLQGCGGDSSLGTAGTLNLGIKDAPVDDASKVVVEFTGIEIKPAFGSSINIDFDTAKQIDLLNLQGTDFAFLATDVSLSPGKYNWIRLKINATYGVPNSYIELTAGGQYPLYVPSGNENGLKLINGFVMPSGGTVNLTIDFDLRKSVLKPTGGNYKLKPTLRLVDNSEVGHISGIVTPTTLSHVDCTATDYAVYVFEYAGVTPDDVDGNDPEPVTTALVTLNSGSGDYEYTAGFLNAGEYTVSFTCDAAADDPETDDTLKFIGTSNATVTAGQTTTHDF